MEMPISDLLIKKYINYPDEREHIFGRIYKLISRISKLKIQFFLEELIKLSKDKKSFVIQKHIALIFLFLKRYLESEVYLFSCYNLEKHNEEIIMQIAYIAGLRQDLHVTNWSIDTLKKLNSSKKNIEYCKLILSLNSNLKKGIIKSVYYLLKYVEEPLICEIIFDSAIRIKDEYLLNTIIRSSNFEKILSSLPRQTQNICKRLLYKCLINILIKQRDILG